MPRKATTLALDLSEEARAELLALARSRTASAHHVERSAIILHLADRRDATQVAATLRIDRQRVTRCARRVLAVGRSRRSMTCHVRDGIRRSRKWRAPG